MGTKRAIWCSAITLLVFFVGSTGRADTIVGSGTAAFQGWSVGDLKNNGRPYWNNKSSDSKNKQEQKTSNIGFYLAGESSVPLDDGPDDALPYWGKSGKSKKKNGGNADLNFYFQRSDLTNTALLSLEMDSASNIDEFGWYDIADPSTLYPILLGPDSPVTNVMFTPSLQYGLYLKRGDEATFYTQSDLNPFKDTLHQHFAVYQQSSVPGAEVYWLGIENRTRRELKKKEGGLGDYNDMIIEIRTIPEPSSLALVLSGALLTAWLRRRGR
jgi:hypothetical protein